MAVLPEVLFFFTCTTGIVYISRISLRSPDTHGFIRIFAIEASLALFLLNARQMFSWMFLLGSLYLVIAGSWDKDSTSPRRDKSLKNPSVW